MKNKTHTIHTAIVRPDFRDVMLYIYKEIFIIITQQ